MTPKAQVPKTTTKRGSAPNFNTAMETINKRQPMEGRNHFQIISNNI
jgi:hypothetical protein